MSICMYLLSTLLKEWISCLLRNVIHTLHALKVCKGGEGGGRRRKNPQVKTRDDQLPTDGPDHTTRPKGHHSGQG